MRSYKTLVQSSFRYRLYVTLLLVFGIVSCWQVLLYRPLNHSIRYYGKKNDAASAQLQELERVQAQCSELSKTINGYERDLKAYQAATLDSNEFLAFVVKHAMLTRLYLVTCMAEPVMNHGWCQSHSLRIDVQGSFNDIVVWLKAISDKSRLISLPSVSIAQAKQGIVQCSTTISCLNIQGM
jgi:Tfp pilus assembly protein PilO